LLFPLFHGNFSYLASLPRYQDINL